MTRHPSNLAHDLASQRARSGDWAGLYDRFVEALRLLGVGQTAPAVGAPFPEFSLPNSLGQYRSLDGMLAEGPLVLSFNRGYWCPYCVHELKAWNDVLPELHAAGAQFAAITPEVGGRAALLGNLLDTRAEILADVDGGVALNTGLAFFAGEELLAAYRSWGLNLKELYGTDGGILPVPATFLIDAEGTTRFSFVDPDFRERAEPADVIAALKRLG